MTEDSPAAEFIKDTVRRNKLAALLKNPVLVEALGIVEDQMEPQTGTQADVHPAVAAAKMHQVAGANELLKRLRALAKEPKEVKVPKGRTLAKTVEDLKE